MLCGFGFVTLHRNTGFDENFWIIADMGQFEYGLIFMECEHLPIPPSYNNKNHSGIGWTMKTLGRNALLWKPFLVVFQEQEQRHPARQMCSDQGLPREGLRTELISRLLIHRDLALSRFVRAATAYSKPKIDHKQVGHLEIWGTVNMIDIDLYHLGNMVLSFWGYSKK